MLIAFKHSVQGGETTDLEVESWLEVIGHLDYTTAIDAAKAHVAESADHLQPAHILGRVRAAHRAALPQTMSEEAPESCPEGRHRRLPDGTCLFCIDREER